jgi:hypothetical protein
LIARRGLAALKRFWRRVVTAQNFKFTSPAGGL